MTKEELQDLMAGIAPVIKEYVTREIEKVRSENVALRKELEGLAKTDDNYSRLDIRISAHDDQLKVLEANGLVGDASLEERVKALERGDAGVFIDGQTYERGAGVTWDGAYYRAQRTTRTTPDSGSGDWRQCVKRGKQGKDGRPADDSAIDRRLRHHGLIG